MGQNLGHAPEDCDLVLLAKITILGTTPRKGKNMIHK